MKKDTKVCWSCGAGAMEPYDEVGHGWLKCSNCGATHQPNPTKETFETLLITRDPGGRGTSYSPGRGARKPRAQAKSGVK